MNDPKKLVPSCTCPPAADAVEAPDLGGWLEPPMPQFTVQLRLDSPPVNSEPPVDPQPAPPPDAVAAFVEASVAVDRRAFTSTAEIMAAARVWCAENDALPFGPRALAEQLKRRRGVQAHSNGQRRGWRGVKLR